MVAYTRNERAHLLTRGGADKPVDEVERDYVVDELNRLGNSVNTLAEEFKRFNDALTNLIEEVKRNHDYDRKNRA